MKKSRTSKKPIPKEVWIALLGFLGVVITALLTSPILLEILKQGSAQSNASPTLPASAGPTSTLTGVPTSTPAVPVTKNAPTINSLPPILSGKITFYRDDMDFYMMNLDGTHETLIAHTGVDLFCPSVSPNGQRVAFVSYFEGFPDIYLMNREGTDLTNLTSTMQQREICPAWSPSGTQLLFARQYSEDSDLFVINADGSSQKNLTQIVQRGITTFWGYTESAWSPDASQIVVSAKLDVFDSELYIIMADSGDIRRLTNNPKGNDYSGAWSPTGDYIAYTSAEIGGDSDIYVINVKNSQQTAPTNITKQPGHDTDPAWSPDGKHLLFVSDRDGNKDIYIMDADGANVKKLTNSSQNESNPHWIQ